MTFILTLPSPATNDVVLPGGQASLPTCATGQYAAVVPAKFQRSPPAVTGFPCRAGRAGLSTTRENGPDTVGRRTIVEEEGGDDEHVYMNLL